VKHHTVPINEQYPQVELTLI